MSAQQTVVAARTGVLIARTWGLRPLGLGLAGVVVLSSAWQGPVSIPVRQDVAEVVWPLAPCLFALVIPGVAARAHTDQERCAPRSAWRRRAVFVGVLGAGMLLAATLLSIFHPFSVVARNGLLLVGLALACTIGLPQSTRWIPVSFFPIVTWLLGARSAGDDPAGWAVLLHAPGSAPAFWAATGCFLAGTVLYVVAERPMRS
ncbi:MAG: hypothetical protein ACRD0O_05215 [Acidimicrobiia bacterium]